MGIYRIQATKDSVIYDSFKGDTDEDSKESNVGLADSLELFTVYGRNGGSTREKSRILLYFPLSDLQSEISSGEIDSSASYFLRLFNVEHHLSLPRNFEVEVHRVTSEWNEGIGVDLDGLTDEDAVSWSYRIDTPIQATGSIQITVNPTSNFAVNVRDNSITVAPGASILDTVNNIVSGISSDMGEDVTFVSNGVDTVNITAVNYGTSGNFIGISVTNTDGTFVLSGTTLTGGSNFTSWTTEGGDFNATAEGSVSFSDGDEDFELDITSLVNEWLDSTYDNHGILLKMTENIEDVLVRSFYTKRFSGRGSQFFLKRPLIEVRWNNARLDDRARFYSSTTLLPTSDSNNQNIVYLETRIDGELIDINNDNAYVPDLAIYSDEDYTTEIVPTVKTITRISTGLYQAVLNLTTTDTEVYFSWQDGTIPTIVYKREKIYVKSEREKRDSYYIVSIANLKKVYQANEKVSFDIFTRLRSDCPNAYYRFNQDLIPDIPKELHYQLRRVEDDLIVIDYDVDNDSTRLSRNKEGSYFVLDMGILDPDWMYEIRLARIFNGRLEELEEKFKFRVEKEYD